MIVEIGGVLVTTELFSEKFCCDLSACKGACCVEGDAGAPVRSDEIAGIEAAAEAIWEELSATAQAVIDKQGVVYNDCEGDLVTSIIGKRNCVFTCCEDLETGGEKIKDCCLCLLEKAFQKGRSRFPKPVSCALYPIREKHLANGKTGLNYDRWDICTPARRKGERLNLPLYKFLRNPLVRRFGKAWFEEMEEVARQLPAEYLGK